MHMVATGSRGTDRAVSEGEARMSEKTPCCALAGTFACRCKSFPTGTPFDMLVHLRRQRAWSERTFGPGARTAGVLDHIRKELIKIESEPTDTSEWIDVVILALDGAWRAGASPEQIIAALQAKQAKNESRVWPDWRTAPADQAIEHDRTHDAAGLLVNDLPVVDPISLHAAVLVATLEEIQADALRFATADTVGGDLDAMRRAMARLGVKIERALSAPPSAECDRNCDCVGECKAGAPR
jgi:hypothetical protein